MTRPYFSVDARALAMGFAIVGNMAIALTSFPMANLIKIFHGFNSSNIESMRLTEASWEAVVFSSLPLLAIFVVKLIPVAPLSSSPDPIYEDVASTLQFLTAMVLAALAIACAFLRFGAGLIDSNSTYIATAFYSLTSIYIVLLADYRKQSEILRTANLAVLLSIVAICIIFVKRDFILMAIPLLILERRRVRPVWILGAVGFAAALILFNMLARGTVDLQSTLLRVVGNQYKYLERYSMHFGIYDHCYGTATLWAFTDPVRYQAFYNLIFDPITVVAGGSAARWDSSNLQERLNYAFCSVNLAHFIYFAVITLLLLLEKKLADRRYFNTAFIIIVFAFEGFNYYNIPQVIALVLLFLSGIWRIGRGAVSPASSRDSHPVRLIAGPPIGKFPHS